MAATAAVLDAARHRPGYAPVASPIAAVERLARLAHTAAMPAPRPRLVLCWTVDGDGRPVCHWDAEPPD